MSTIKQRQTIKPVTVLLHLGIWLLVVQVLFDFQSLYYSFKELQGKVVDEVFILMPLMVVSFYLNMHFLTPRFLNHKLWWKFVLILVLGSCAYIGIGMGVFFLATEREYIFLVDDWLLLEMLAISIFLVLGSSTSIGLFRESTRNMIQKGKAEEKQREAEMKYLSAQVNPHFLYNSLNMVYAMASEEKAEKTSEAVLKLSEIMRYPIQEGLLDEIPLTREIKFIRDYIALQRLRLGKEYPIDFSIEEPLPRLNIPPFLFIPLVENAFKYGVSQHYYSPLRFRIEGSDKELIFQSENTIHERAGNSTQMGVANLRARMDILYPDAYVLDIRKENRKYIVHMKISLKGRT